MSKVVKTSFYVKKNRDVKKTEQHPVPQNSFEGRVDKKLKGSFVHV